MLEWPVPVRRCPPAERLLRSAAGGGRDDRNRASLAMRSVPRRRAR